DVHKVCNWVEKGSQKVYKALKEEVLIFIKQVQERVLRHEEDHSLLKAYNTEWKKFFTQCDYLPKPFSTLESNLQGKAGSGSSKRPLSDGVTVQKLMLDAWNEGIFSSIKTRLQSSAMKLVYAERNGEAFDSQLVIGVRESYVNLSSDITDKLMIYTENFEKAYVDATREFYKTQASTYLQKNGVQNYMKYAEMKLKEEEQRANRYLETRKGCNSVAVLTECCVNVLVGDFKETILAECPGMQSDSEKYVEQLLALFNRFSQLVKEAFNDDPRFLTSRDKAFKSVVNDTSIFKLELPGKSKIGGSLSVKPQPESRCPELLANYCDMLLRKTTYSKRLTSDEIEAKLKDVLLVLKYVVNKDVFMRYHKAHLTRRLILDTSADSEMEENMVEWLRDVGMPADYINKLARMFQDIKVSDDLNQEFKKHYKCKGDIADSINIKILNAGAWSRASERIPVSLPTDLEDCIPEVEEFYRKNHSGRKLQWHHLMSNGVITFGNKIGKFDLEVTTFQMSVLFAWNERPLENITLENLRLATELPDAELRKTLWSMVSLSKLKRQVLVCDPPARSPKDFTDSSMFCVNQEFALIKNGKIQKRGKVNLIGRLQLSTEKTKLEENEGIVALRVLRIQ
ncbi:hypothetical protein QZH41_009466, partial [Actinostola sp. cb2023]